MRYQFQIDGRPAAPLRSKWEDAAWDAVEAGYGTWKNPDAVILDSNQGATIERFNNANPRVQ
jgi:hypothetical protein